MTNSFILIGRNNTAWDGESFNGIIPDALSLSSLVVYASNANYLDLSGGVYAILSVATP